MNFDRFSLLGNLSNVKRLFHRPYAWAEFGQMGYSREHLRAIVLYICRSIGLRAVINRLARSRASGRQEFSFHLCLTLKFKLVVRHCSEIYELLYGGEDL